MCVHGEREGVYMEWVKRVVTGRGYVYMDGVECVHGERERAYGRGLLCVHRERENVCIWKGWGGCVYMEGLECTMHGDREDVYIRKGWSVNARREGRCVHMCASSVCAWREER